MSLQVLECRHDLHCCATMRCIMCTLVPPVDCGTAIRVDSSTILLYNYYSTNGNGVTLLNLEMLNETAVAGTLPRSRSRETRDPTSEHPTGAGPPGRQICPYICVNICERNRMVYAIADSTWSCRAVHVGRRTRRLLAGRARRATHNLCALTIIRRRPYPPYP